MKLLFVMCVTILLALIILTNGESDINIFDDIEQINLDKKDYAEVLNLSLLFYEAQRSGKLPKDNRIPWRNDSALNDTGEEGEDLTGGYYDSNNYVKYTFSTAFTTTVLAWGVISWPEAFNIANQLDEVRKTIKWATDYLIKCHVSENVLYGQVGNFSFSEHNWGRPEDILHSRKAYKTDQQHPGSDLVGETAAALAASSIVFKNVDPEYSAECLKHAKDLYNFAINYRGFYHNIKTTWVQNVKLYYNNTDYGDELAWAAIWIYKADQQFYYLEEAENHYDFYLWKRPNEFSCTDKTVGVQVLLAQLTGKLEYHKAVRNFCDFSVHQQTRTPKGLLYIDKRGTLALAANVAFICLEAADFEIGASHQYYKFAKEQIDYMLGKAEVLGKSYVVGYGYNSPKQPFHVAASCPDRPQTCGWEQYWSLESNPQILYGALVSGPNEKDEFIDLRYKDISQRYTNVNIDYNAGFTCVLAKLLQLDCWQICMTYSTYIRLFKQIEATSQLVKCI